MIDETKIFLDYATITAPFDGVVVDKQVQAGDMVTPGQTLLTVYDPNQMQLVANVRESLAMKLKVGQEVTAKLESLDHECLATVRGSTSSGRGEPFIPSQSQWALSPRSVQRYVRTHSTAPRR
ncbi:MAG: efflux RND transporter periplasmic adaptor subunit [Pirellulaceae bacterium]